MKLKEKIRIDLLEFFKTGKFDYLKLGKTKEWIINNFPDPDDFSLDDEVWRYGNIELHFSNNELFLIYSDYIDTLDGGHSLELDKWILEDPEKLNLDYTIRHLNKERIDFKVEHRSTQGLSHINLELLRSTVTLGFSPVENDDENLQELLEKNKTEDSNRFKLDSFSLTRK